MSASRQRAVSAAVLVGGVALFWWRVGGADGLRSLRKVRAFDVPRGAIKSTAAVLVALMLTTVGLDAWSAPRSASDAGGVTIPTGPALADVTLDGAAFDAAFARGVTDGGQLALVIGYEGVEGGPFGLVLIDGAGIERSLGGFGEGTTMGVASSRPRLLVAEGPWVVRLWAEGTAGRIRLWLDEEALPTY